MRTLQFSILCLLFVGCDFSAEAPPPPENKTEALETDPHAIQAQYEAFLKSRGSDTLPRKIIKERGKIYPADQSVLDTTLFVFINQLQKAIDDKDIFFILDHLDEEVNNGEGYANSTDGFVDKWRLKNDVSTQLSDLWIVLRHILRNGGVINNRRTRYVAPYYRALYPVQTPSDTTGVILGQGVRIRTAPNSSSKIMQTLSLSFSRHHG